jgi:hypothetical protein
MRIKITKGQVLDDQENDSQESPTTLFPAGEYLANLKTDKGFIFFLPI